MNKGENERLAVVETEVRNVKDVVIRIEKKLDLMPTNYASKGEVESVAQELEEYKKTTKEQLQIIEMTIKQQDTKTTWKLVVAYSVAVVGLITSAILLYELLRPKG